MTDTISLPNHSLKEDIRAYWSKRAETFDQSAGHRIEDTAEAPAWKALFGKALGDLADKAVLDLACGTGEISRMLLGMGARVTGVDFAEPMLERARRKHADQTFTGRLGDVEHLHMEPDAAYDAVVTRHLVWTLVHPHVAFAEWRRVLKPGGRLLVVDGDWVTSTPIARVLRVTANRLSPRNGVHGGADVAEHERLVSQVHYLGGLTEDRLRRDLAAHGFGDFRSHSMAPVYLWGMRKAPFGDWLRLNAATRFALSCAAV
jgi:ubiquinone/menaquinone biosynthesis C-methylase UbiE